MDVERIKPELETLTLRYADYPAAVRGCVVVGRVVLTGDGPPGPEDLSATARGHGGCRVGEIVATRPASLCVESEGQPGPTGVEGGWETVAAQLSQPWP